MRRWIDIMEQPMPSKLDQPFMFPASKKHHVLIVEDNPIAQTVAKTILDQLDCAADIAENGSKAVEMWKVGSYDLIFMDIGLPDIDGYEVTQLIRAQELPKETLIPIVALTAHLGDENKNRCINAGMNAVLTKPLTVKNCADIVKTFIPSRQTQNPASLLCADLPEHEKDLFNLISFPTFDVEEGIKTTGEADMLAEMLQIMVKGELLQDVEQMKEAFAHKDWNKTQQLAHKIKGGAVYVGTVRMKMACQYLERYWKVGKRDLLESLYEQMLTVIDETIKETQNWLSHKSLT
jgi:two-component system aerobic respiration control sensor histidine kinase ArcB